MDINNYLNIKWSPLHFMTIYRNEVSDLYLEIGDIIKKDDKYILGASQPVDEEFLFNMVELIKARDFNILKFKGLIPENILNFSFGNGSKPKIIWYRVPESRYLYFSEEMGIESTVYHLPYMVFSLENDELSVFFTTEKPNIKTELYQVPLPNIYYNDKVCLGNAKQKIKKPKCLEEVVELYEDLFYKTQFNALHNTDFLEEDDIYIELMKDTDLRKFKLKKASYTCIQNLL